MDIKKWLGSHNADIAVRIMVMLSVIMSIIIAVEQYQLTACNTRYHEANAAVVKARAEAAEEDNKAQDEFFRAVFEGKSSEDAQRAYDNYVMVRAETEKKRRENPPPELLSKYC